MTKLERAYRNVCIAANKLSKSLEILSSVASELYGEELHADLCSGEEIEFRRLKNGHIDDYDTLRIEDIMKEH